MHFYHDNRISTRTSDLAPDSPVIIRQKMDVFFSRIIIIIFGSLLSFILYATIHSEKSTEQKDFGLLVLLITFLALVTAFGFLLMLYQRTITVRGSMVTCCSWCLVPLSDWNADLSEYRGILLRRSRQPKFDLCLLHASERKSLRIFESNKYPKILEHWKNLTARLNIPALEYDGDDLIELAPDDIDKSLSALLKENKLGIKQLLGVNQEEILVEKKASSTILIHLNRDKVYASLLWIPVLIFILLIGAGIHTQSITPPKASPYFYLIYYFAAALIFIAGCLGTLYFLWTKHVIRLEQGNLIHARITKSGRELFPKIIPFDQIRLIHDPDANYPSTLLCKGSLTIDTFSGPYEISLNCSPEARDTIKQLLLDYSAHDRTN